MNRLKAVPGVVDVGLTNTEPLRGCLSRSLSAGNRPPPEAAGGEGPPWVCYQPVTPGYLRMLGIPILKGRLFGDSDQAGSAPVAVISESTARRYFPDEDPVGKMVTISQPR